MQQMEAWPGSQHWKRQSWGQKPGLPDFMAPCSPAALAETGGVSPSPHAQHRHCGPRRGWADLGACLLPARASWGQDWPSRCRNSTGRNTLRRGGSRPPSSSRCVLGPWDGHTLRVCIRVCTCVRVHACAGVGMPMNQGRTQDRACLWVSGCCWCYLFDLCTEYDSPVTLPARF